MWARIRKISYIVLGVLIFLALLEFVVLKLFHVWLFPFELGGPVGGIILLSFVLLQFYLSEFAHREAMRARKTDLKAWRDNNGYDATPFFVDLQKDFSFLALFAAKQSVNCRRATFGQFKGVDFGVVDCRVVRVSTGRKLDVFVHTIVLLKSRRSFADNIIVRPKSFKSCIDSGWGKGHTLRSSVLKEHSVHSEDEAAAQTVELLTGLVEEQPHFSYELAKDWVVVVYTQPNSVLLKDNRASVAMIKQMLEQGHKVTEVLGASVS